MHNCPRNTGPEGVLRRICWLHKETSCDDLIYDVPHPRLSVLHSLPVTQRLPVSHPLMSLPTPVSDWAAIADPYSQTVCPPRCISYRLCLTYPDA